MVSIVPLNQCVIGGGTFVHVQGLELAVFRLTDPQRVYVLDNSCPHAGGNLAGGDIEELVVSCPWHHWKFSLETGVCTHSAAARVRRYRCAVRDGVVWADLSVEGQQATLPAPDGAS